MMTFFLVPYYAVGAELTENYNDRTALVAVRNIFYILKITKTELDDI